MTKELLQQALDALTRLSFLGNGDFPGNSEGNRIAQKAVADIKQALSQQEQPNRWSQAVIDQLVVHHIYCAEHDADPRKAINDLLRISNDIALDPSVSSDAQALIDRGRNEAQQDQPAQEPVMYQYRWLNPGDNPDQPESELEWKLVEVRNVYTDTIANRIDELRGYRFSGKPVYEVRPLYAAPPTQPALSDEQVLSRLNVLMNLEVIRYPSTLLDVWRACEAHCRGGNHG